MPLDQPNQSIEFLKAGTAALGAVVALVKTIGAGISALASLRARKKGRKPKTVRDILKEAVENKCLTEGEVKKIERTLKSRLAVAVSMSAIVVIFAVLTSYQLYRGWPPRKQLTRINFSSMGPLSLEKDQWLTDNAFLRSLALDLKPVDGNDDAFRQFSAQTERFGATTSGAPIFEATCIVTFSPVRFDFKPPYILLCRTSTQSYELLTATEIRDGAIKFRIPPSDGQDFLVIIGGLTKNSDNAFPKDWSKTLDIEVK